MIHQYVRFVEGAWSLDVSFSKIVHLKNLIIRIQEGNNHFLILLFFLVAFFIRAQIYEEKVGSNVVIDNHNLTN